ncbi:Aste57867_8843 [Aphanomyces stellatus]|uniref:Aste57867_8843 protein n=1 Tax=Aphanomyces stellatus TaxID=120398 RepID=A0A485KL97_9STRA|nr:hypothetical protein As57867_008808 [Aphanomyces stellatus]VFT85729.1 Aste57867_8843 [Aphanomyces stellatus]
MSSKLNPNAGAFVPSFVVPIETAVSVPTPSPGTKKSKANAQAASTAVQSGTPSSKAARASKASPEAVVVASAAAIIQTAPDDVRLPEVHTVADLAPLGRIMNGQRHYSIAELLQFRPFYTALPPRFDAAAVHAICGGTVKEKSKAAVKREKQRAAAAAQPVHHYDPNAYASYYAKSTDAENPKPRHKPTDNPEQETKDAIDKVNMLLDQLPPTDIAVEATINLFHDIPVTCTLSLQAVVGVLFDRAIAAPHLCHFYAPFCSGLSDTMPDFKDGARTINFRRILLTKCYEALVEDDPDQASWRRQSMLGNVVLIGELFRRQLLTENIMHVCVAMMLDTDMETLPPPPVMQAACQLLLLVGDLLDGSSPASRRTMDEYFDALQRLACHETLQPRLGQLIQETIDARASGWIRKRVECVDVVATTQSV